MALFTVNRFMGDEEEEEEIQAHPGQAESILARLQREAEARRRKKEGSSDEKKVKKKKEEDDLSVTPRSEISDTQNELSYTSDKEREKKAKKQKRKKKEVRLESDVDVVKSDDLDTDVSPSAKRKKKKRKHQSENSVSQDNEDRKKLKKSNVDEIGSESKDEYDENGQLLDEGEGRRDLNVTLEEGSQEVGGFTVLGDYKKKDKEQVRRVLPDWLANPSVISADLRNKRLAISEMVGLDSQLVRKLEENKITHFFPVQMQVIPELLDVVKYGCLMGRGGNRPQDICVSAPTGSGKTLAFVLPIIQALKDRVVRKVRAVTVLPVKDLAVQVFKVFQVYAQGTDLKVGLAVGQKTFAAEQQSLVVKKLRGYMSLVDILVATPGRLVDHINNTEGFDLSQLRFLVIDEADRMMDDIKQDWLSTLEGAVYIQTDRQLPGPLTVSNCSRAQIPLQKMLFSATLSQNPEKLQHLNLFQPRLFTSVVKVTLEEEKRIGRALTGNLDQEQEDESIDTVAGEFVGKYTTPASLKELFVRVSAAEKPLMILHFLHALKYRQVLCFTNSREAAHRLHLLVKTFGEDVRVQEFSSNISSSKRNRILKDFSASKIDLLICSDVMARGMDVNNVQFVVSYDTTPHIKTYIHRIGRTARAGKEGTAITMLENKEIYHFKKMVQDAGKTNVKEMQINKEELAPLVEKFQLALKKLPSLLMEEKKKKKQKG